MRRQTRLWIARSEVSFIHFRVQNPRNINKNIFREKQATNKIQLMFLDVKVLTEVEAQNTGILTHLEGKKQQRRYRTTYSDVSK